MSLLTDFLKDYDLPISKAEIRSRYWHLTPRQAIAAMRRLKGAKMNPAAQARYDMRGKLLAMITLESFGEIQRMPKSTRATITIRRPKPYHQ